ncbi:Transposon Tf2-9 polyprotein [Stylophora pistillata]|uniref:Transposon Tf2-9 polyprotein n=1 Tax=Stylophora pistillata TaxID=50429 RepID=A0A2B4R8P2_STYPI|nr:Transposon Tf2-9 polyprotein [Stylophora pistillata]
MLPPENLPPPKPLIVDENLASNWKQWKKVWQRYEIATRIYKQEDLVRVSTLLSVIGEDAVKAFDTFVWSEGQKEDCIKDVLTKFYEYCEPRAQAKCRSTTPQINTVEEVTEEVFRISQVGCGSRAMITMEVGKPSSQSQVTFQLDTGAEYNLLSLKDYRRVTGDVDLKQVNLCSHKFIKTSTNERYRIMGSKELPIWRHGKRDVLLFNITEDDLAALLSYSTCTELGLVTINDCDRAIASNSYGLDSTPGVDVTTGITDLLDEYKDVFQGLGDLPGEYHLVTDDVVPPVVHPPLLNEMVASDIINPGLRPDPEKIQAILQMPEPKDVTALKRFLGMVTYLAKFMPHLSEMTEPLRRLEDKNVEFQWLPQQLPRNEHNQELSDGGTCSSLL